MNDQDRFEKEVTSEQWEDEESALEWLADPVAQKEYEDFLKSLERKPSE